MELVQIEKQVLHHLWYKIRVWTIFFPRVRSKVTKGAAHKYGRAWFLSKACAFSHSIWYMVCTVRLLDASLYVISNPESHRLTCWFLHSTEPVWAPDFRAWGSGGDCVMGNVPSFLNQQLSLHGGHPVHSIFLVVFSTLERPGMRPALYLARSADVSIKAGGQSGTNWVYMRASCSCAAVAHKSIWSENLGVCTTARSNLLLTCLLSHEFVR